MRAALPTIQVIEKQLGNAGMITMRFGAGDDEELHGLSNLQGWVKRLDERGLA